MKGESNKLVRYFGFQRVEQQVRNGSSSSDDHLVGYLEIKMLYVVFISNVLASIPTWDLKPSKTAIPSEDSLDYCVSSLLGVPDVEDCCPVPKLMAESKTSHSLLNGLLE